MSVNSHILMSATVTQAQVGKYLSSIKNTGNIQTIKNVHYSNEGYNAFGTLSGYILFEIIRKDGNATRRGIFYINGISESDSPDTKFYKKPFTFLSFDCDNEAVHIMKRIVGYFGGYFDANDCDSIPYEYIKGKLNTAEHIEAEHYKRLSNLVENLGLHKIKELTYAQKMSIALNALQNKDAIVSLLS